uniref:Uncharacterized protein n=1 Tax=Cannabis sativa TaxID=3483 RepID=A0A803NTS7_CANSA
MLEDQQLHQQHQAAIHAQMAMRPIGTNNGIHPMHHVEAAAAVGASGSVGLNSAAGPNERCGGGKQECSEAETVGAVVRGPQLLKMQRTPNDKALLVIPYGFM